MRLTQNHTLDITHRCAIACCQAALRWMTEEKALLACFARRGGAGARVRQQSGFLAERSTKPMRLKNVADWSVRSLALRALVSYSLLDGRNVQSENPPIRVNFEDADPHFLRFEVPCRPQE
jgi:hypothetical protein